MMPKCAQSLVIVVLLTLAAPALAQDVATLNEEGIEAFQDERFADAAQKFREAYDVDPQPTLKKNEFVAWFKADRCDEAVPTADQYIGLEDAEPASIVEAKAVLAKCTLADARTDLDEGDFAGARKKLEGIETAELAPELVGEIRSVQDEIDTAEEAKRQEEEAALAEARAAEDTEAQNTLGYALTGAGGGVMLIGLIYHIYALASLAPRYREVGAAGEDRAKFRRLGNQLATARVLVPTLYAVGLLTGGAGVYFLAFQPETAAGSQTAGLPAARGFEVRWRF